MTGINHGDGEGRRRIAASVAGIVLLAVLATCLVGMARAFKGADDVVRREIEAASRGMVIDRDRPVTVTVRDGATEVEGTTWDRDDVRHVVRVRVPAKRYAVRVAGTINYLTAEPDAANARLRRLDGGGTVDADSVVIHVKDGSDVTVDGD